ncbi:hypothetical protein ABZ446_04705 [Streptomyces sp. NPDC005813]|uniref:hypothetical protein n=1 Tax=Streptomyces sp. NPDC005813 TaxID=3155592 RepID=UPI00340457AB
MSRHDPQPQPQPPGPPAPPDPGHLLARTGVRWTIIGVLVSTLLTVVGLVVQARQGHDDTARGGSSAGSSGTNGGPGPSEVTQPVTASATSPVASPPDDGSGLTAAERALRDSLNTDQWRRESCERETAPGATAALKCTVTTSDATAGTVTTKADIALYPSRSKLQEVYRSYAANLPEGNCDQTMNVRGTWHENDSSAPAGDMACYTADTTRYVIFCTYYDRPALFQVTGADPAALTSWWHTLDPVFTD